MKNIFSRGIVILSVLMTAASCSAVGVQYNPQYAKANSVFVINKIVIGQTIVFGPNTTIKLQGGMFKNCKLQGNNTSIITSGDDVVFDNCTFSGVFVNSNLKATHFGCKPDMTAKAIVWKSKDGTSVKTRKHQGTDNKRALTALAQFCSNSQNLTVIFNGDFFTPVVDNTKGKPERDGNYLTISNAKALTMSGGRLIQGIWFYNCSDLHLHDISFVGLHEIHDFPPIYSKESSFSNTKGTYYQEIKKSGYTAENTANITADQYCRLGLAGASTIRVMTDNGGKSQNVLIENCHFEMRNGGIGTGSNTARHRVESITIRNCDFSHIYYQPVGFGSVSNALVDNIVVDYCLQGVDIGRWSNHVIVRNSKFYNCFSGPKQQLAIKEKADLADCFDNSFDNCYFQLNDKLRYIDVVPFILLAGQATEGSSFTVSNTTFDVNHDIYSEGVLCRASGLNLNNVTININGNTSREKSDLSRLFNTGASLLLGAKYIPHITLNHVTINANTRIGYLASSTGPKFDLTLNNVNIQGNALCAYSAFSGLNRLSMSGTNIDISCNSSLIEKTPQVSMSGVKCQNIAGMLYNSGGINDDVSVSISDCQLKCKGKFLNLYKTNKVTSVISGSNIKCSSLVSFTEDPNNLSLNIYGNEVMATGGVIFMGVQQASRSFVPNRVMVKNNRFNAQTGAVLYEGKASNNVRNVFRSNTVDSSVKMP